MTYFHEPSENPSVRWVTWREYLAIVNECEVALRYARRLAVELAQLKNDQADRTKEDE
jgi:hypothetical protein